MTDPRSILVCRLSALGDIVLTLPTVEALRRRFPQARIEFVARTPFGGILRDEPAIDGVHDWAGGGAPLPEAARDRDWDLVVDLSGSGRSRRLLAGLKRGRLLRTSKQSLRRFAFVHARALGANGDGIVPAVERMLATLHPLGIDPLHSERCPRLSAAASGTATGSVLLAPGAGRTTKRWPLPRFVELAERLAAETRRSVLVVGSPQEREDLEAVAKPLSERATVVSEEDPGQLPARLGGAELAVTNDSALLHIAEACGVPVVAVFGPTHPRLGFAPRHPDSRVLRTGISCSPCDLHGPERCPKGHHRCMIDLTVEAVWTEVAARLLPEVAA